MIFCHRFIVTVPSGEFDCEHCGSHVSAGDRAVRGEMYDSRDPEGERAEGLFCGRGCAELELPRMMLDVRAANGKA